MQTFKYYVYRLRDNTIVGSLIHEDIPEDISEDFDIGKT